MTTGTEVAVGSGVVDVEASTGAAWEEEDLEGEEGGEALVDVGVMEAEGRGRRQST